MLKEREALLDGNEVELLDREISLAELAKSKSRMDRENEELQEELEEQKQLEAAQNDIK